MEGSNIQSSQKRDTLPAHNVVNGFRPLNGGNEVAKDVAGMDTKNIQKSSTDEQAGPITNNL